MLGKTRRENQTHPDQAELEQRYDERTGPPRGVLQRPAAAGKFKHFRMDAPAELAPWVAHCWMASWDIGPPGHHIAETLPHPSFHLVFEDRGWTLSGVPSGKFTRRLEGRSFAFGVKFTPGGIHPFLKKPAAFFANKTVPAEEIFGVKIKLLLRNTARPDEMEEAMVKEACGFLLAEKPESDPVIAQVSAIVESILRQPELKTVDQLSASTGLGKRALQRLFHEYVGATPKWVIRRYRLHELVERCHSGEGLDFAQLALDLGYFDQAHLINDFRSIIGYTPTQYRKIAGSAKASGKNKK
jgi:AraC-like DNA-binding protein